MKKDLIVNLIKEVNTKVKNRTISNMLVEKANAYHAEGMNEISIFSSVLQDVRGFNESLKNSDVTELIEKYSKFEKAPAITLTRMMNECGLTQSIKRIQGNSIYADPVIRTSVDRLAESIKTGPEFRFIPSFIELLKPFSYDKTIKTAVEEAHSFLQKNSTKLLLLNSIFELKLIPSNMYQKVVAILEQSLLDNAYSADSIKMKLREQLDIPIVKRIVNDLILVESKQTKQFSLGIGSDSTMIESVITPSIKHNGTVIALLNNKFVSISEKEVTMTDPEIFKDEALIEYYNFCLAFSNVGFKPKNESIHAKLKNIEIEMKNEGQDLALYINKAKVKDLNNINFGGIFLMENTDTRTQVASILNNLKFVTSLDFIKHITNESLGCYIINLEKSIFVLENTAPTSIQKMNGSQLYEFMLKHYNYNISAIVESELTEKDKNVLALEKKKAEITENIKKLESSLNNLDEALLKNLNDDDVDTVKDLRFTIEKKITSLKEEYISIDQQKKKLFETEILKDPKSHSIQEEVKLKDGRFGKIVGVDTAAGRYMVKTEDGKISPMRGTDIQ